MIELLLPALVVCLVLGSVLTWFGIHVLMREVIFVDLALAQLAALGATVGHVLFHDGPPVVAWLCSFAFTLAGAALFAWLRPERTRIPQEALIGVVYGVGAALVILILSKSALDRDQIEGMLTGRLLFTAWSDVALIAGLSAAVGGLHFLLRGPFLRMSLGASDGSLPSRRTLLDFVFYASFGVVVTGAVQLAGVLVVFGLLIVPAACARMFVASVPAQLAVGWLVSAAACVLGISASAAFDLPTGASVVAALGASFVLALAGALLVRSAPPGR